MTSYYESATSGMNYDRFPSSGGSGIASRSSGFAEDFFNESTISKMKQHFWTAKQLFRSKLGKKEDEHLLASDADLDTKLTRYFALHDTTRRLLAHIEDYHHFSEEIVDLERDLVEFLRREMGGEKEHLQKVMKIATVCVGGTSKHRRRTLRPLIRIYHELDVFNERAISDCQGTVEAAERARVEYRGSLLWIKSTSEELDPASSAQMEKFRVAQNVVRQKKEKFDSLKSDTFQKVDVLTQSRATLLNDLARELFDSVRKFYVQSAKEFENITAQLDGIDSYEIDVLKILNDPVGLALKRQKETEKDRQNSEHQKGRLMRAHDKKSSNARSSEIGNNYEEDYEEDGSVIELEEIEVGQIVTDVPRLQPAPLGKRYKKNLQDPTTSTLIQLNEDSIQEQIPGKNPERTDSEGNPGQIATIRNDYGESVLFRVESPLGILDDEKLEWELNNALAQKQLASAQEVPSTVNTKPNSAEIFSLFDEPSFNPAELNDASHCGISAVENCTIPRLKPPPSSITAPSISKKAGIEPLLCEEDDMNFSTINLNGNIFEVNDNENESNSTLNIQDTPWMASHALEQSLKNEKDSSSNFLPSICAPQTQNKNLSCFLADELDAALNFGVNKNSSQQM